ncbi:MAG: hypothetical protein U9R15_19815 [Chloroflexota bacterium]|nr:hypothetical protein [Chloroflexota bacterium]
MVRFPGPAAMEQRARQVGAINRYTQAQSAGLRPTGATGHFVSSFSVGRRRARDDSLVA